MANSKISALTAATTPLDGTEVLPIVQSSTTKKVANNDLRPKQIQSNTTSGVMQIVGPAAAATRVMTIPDANFTAARTDSGQTFTGAQNIENGAGTNQRLLYLKQTNDYGYAFNIDSNTTGKLFLKAVNAGVESNFLTFDRSTYDFTVNNGNLVIGTSGKGIDFSATPGTGTSELLADYEEGTWTPGQGTNLTVVGAFSSSGSYTKVGRLVSVVGSVSGATSVSFLGGGLQIITGLPFAAASAQLETFTLINGAFTTSANGFVYLATMASVTAMGATPTIYFSATYRV